MLAEGIEVLSRTHADLEDARASSDVPLERLDERAAIILVGHLDVLVDAFLRIEETHG